MTIDVAVLSFLFTVGRFVVEKLVTFVNKQSQLAQEVRYNIEFIKDEVDSAAALLKDMSSQSVMDSSETLKLWLKQIKDLIYEVEDFLDDYKYCTASGEGCNDIASKLEKIKLKAEDVKKRRERYSFPAGDAVFVANGRSHDASSSHSYDQRLKADFVEKDELVDIENQRDVINWVASDNTPHLRVISIVGPGGMGKTTLAMQCYESRTVICRAKITVTQTFDLKNLLKNLLKQFGVLASETTIKKMDNVELVKKIRNKLRGNKYMVLLDDVWSISAWDDLSCAFPDDGNGSRIIVTTRINSVATICSGRFPRYLHRIQPLSLEKSEELFCSIVSPLHTFNCPSNLAELMHGILEKCDGMPLAIVTVAKILVCNNQILSKEHWERVHDGIGHDWEDGTKKMRQTLMLSYDDLPDDVKPCFLYLSIFPRGFPFKRSDIIRRWIAEGLVRGDVEQIAQSNFDQLVNRSLIDPAIIRCRDVKSWKVHNLMLDIISEKASHANFVYIVDKNFTKRTCQDSKIRRIAIHEEDELSDVVVNLSLVRSLSWKYGTSNNILKMIRFEEMRLLKMLDLEGCLIMDSHYITLICNSSFLLKYLCLKNTRISRRNTRISRLPESIENLQYGGIRKSVGLSIFPPIPSPLLESIENLQDLEVLDVRDFPPILSLPESIENLQDLEVLDVRDTILMEFPKSITKLQRLSHIYTSSARMFPQGMGSMKSLRVLKVKITRGEFEILNISELKQLQKLVIEITSWEENSIEKWKKELITALENLSNSLTSLKILFNGEKGIIRFLDDMSKPPWKLEKIKLGGKLPCIGVPWWLGSLHHLTKMSLLLYHLNEEDIRCLESLPSLLNLHIHILRVVQLLHVGTEISIGPNGFTNLKILALQVVVTFDYIEVTFQPGALPNLELLDLKWDVTGGNLGHTVLGIENLAKLEEINCEISGGDHDIAIQALRRLRVAVEGHANNPRLTIF